MHTRLYLHTFKENCCWILLIYLLIFQIFLIKKNALLQQIVSWYSRDKYYMKKLFVIEVLERMLIFSFTYYVFLHKWKLPLILCEGWISIFYVSYFSVFRFIKWNTVYFTLMKKYFFTGWIYLFIFSHFLQFEERHVLFYFCPLYSFYLYLLCDHRPVEKCTLVYRLIKGCIECNSDFWSK